MKKFFTIFLTIALTATMLSSCAAYEHECKYREALNGISNCLDYYGDIDNILSIIEGHALYEPGDDEFVPYDKYEEAVHDIRDMVDTISRYADIAYR